jgi:dipeptidyl aminopeptidase/acylaminoacyl peptidase
MTMRKQVAAAAAAAVLLGGAATVYVAQASGPPQRRAKAGAAQPAGAAGELDLAATGRVLFRNTAVGPNYGYLASVPVSDPAGSRTYSRTDCERVYVAAGNALCLAAKRGALPSYAAVVLDADLREVRRVDIPGQPSRARLSASGRMASWTMFVSGDSYAASSFSTRTGVLDVRTGQVVQSLEEFAIYRDGARYRAPDVNFWGVTFTRDDNTFYATLRTRGKTYLVRGDLAAREVRTLRENVECPSLSPEGTRIAYKKKVSADPGRPWRLHVLDLATQRDVPLAETASVDDQAAWVDDRTVMYALPDEKDVSNIWVVPADGTGKPRRMLSGAYSPVVVS